MRPDSVVFHTVEVESIARRNDGLWEGLVCRGSGHDVASGGEGVVAEAELAMVPDSWASVLA